MDTTRQVELEQAAKAIRARSPRGESQEADHLEECLDEIRRIEAYEERHRELLQRAEAEIVKLKSQVDGTLGDRLQITDAQIIAAVEAVHKKITERLVQKGYGSIRSSHEGLGLMTEEYKELIDAVQDDDPVAFERESIDIAVQAIFQVACKRAGGMDW